MKKLAAAWVILGAIILGAVVFYFLRGPGAVVVQIDIRQNMELIEVTGYGKGPQLAIWIEDIETGSERTVFVTRRSGTGDWVGKAECPAALPIWFKVWQSEAGGDHLPRLKKGAADAVTGATATGEQFRWSFEVERGRRFICWIEVNQSADFNAAFQEYDESSGRIDTHKSGQPSLLYRVEVLAKAGEIAQPEIYGYAAFNAPTEEINRDLSGITTAKEILKSIEIRVLRR